MTIDSLKEFEAELESLINRFSLENVSDTPDYILAQFLVGCLKSFDGAVNVRAASRGDFGEFTPDMVE